MVALNNKYQDMNFSNGGKFNLVSIALERTDDRWKKVADRFGFDWEYQIVDISRIVATSDLGSSYGVSDIPAKFLIGPEGEFIMVKAQLSEIDDYLSNL